jgi:hypothetical protein
MTEVQSSGMVSPKRSNTGPETQVHVATSPTRLLLFAERSLTCSRNCLPEGFCFSLIYIKVQPSGTGIAE